MGPARRRWIRLLLRPPDAADAGLRRCSFCDDLDMLDAAESRLAYLAQIPPAVYGRRRVQIEHLGFGLSCPITWLPNAGAVEAILANLTFRQ